jgi:hypothetical protein
MGSIWNYSQIGIKPSISLFNSYLLNQESKNYKCVASEFLWSCRTSQNQENPKSIRAHTLCIQIYPNHYFDHNLNSITDFRMLPLAVTWYYCKLSSSVTSYFFRATSSNINLTHPNPCVTYTIMNKCCHTLFSSDLLHYLTSRWIHPHESSLNSTLLMPNPRILSLHCNLEEPIFPNPLTYPDPMPT